MGAFSDRIPMVGLGPMPIQIPSRLPALLQQDFHILSQCIEVGARLVLREGIGGIREPDGRVIVTFENRSALVAHNAAGTSKLY